MNRLFSVAAPIVGSLLLVACATSASTPASTPMPAAPTKAAEPTKLVAPTLAPAAQPTAAKKVAYPAGKPITLIVPWAAGGPNDVSARIAAAGMEKVLGTSIAIVNKAGASGQVGCTDLALAKPDGYTIGMTQIPSTILAYLDPEKKAVFTRASFAPLAEFAADAGVIAVRTESKYKTVKDLVDDAKARPMSIKLGDTGILSGTHVQGLQFQQAAGIKMAGVHFDSAPNTITALLSDSVDAVSLNQSALLATVKGGQVRILGIMDAQESKFYPGVKTMKEQGVDVVTGGYYALSAPAGTPKEIIDILDTAIRKTMESDDTKKKMDDMALTYAYKGAAAFAADWEAWDKAFLPVLELAKQQR